MFSKLKIQLPPVYLLATGLTIVTLLTALSGLWHYNYELSTAHAVPKTISTKQSPKGSAISAASNEGNSPATTKLANKAAFSQPTNSNSTSTNPTTTKTTVPSAATRISTLSVALSINSGLKGYVKLPAGSNQCDVLNQALASGLISSLDMRYSSQYNTLGVYVIDGIGDPGTIWWTYKVNGSAPPYGCGAMPARDGDSVNWQYVKN